MIEAEASPYRPFPDFAKWYRSEMSEAAYDKYASLLADRRKSAGPTALAQAVNTATRVAAVDTGAIEGLYQVDRGFTRTVALEAVAWEAAVEARGATVRSTIEDALAAYELILDLATKHVPVTEAFIRHIHATICATQETYTVHTSQGPQQHDFPKGEYKHYPNNPTSLTTGRIHHYAPVVDTPAEMQRLVDELSSNQFREAHPVLQAAYVHYAFVCVHPFADGNGRVARALASVYLYRKPGVPLVIFADQKDRYIDALEAADDGDSSLLVQFILDRVIDSMQLVLTHIPDVEVPDLSLTLAAFDQAQVGRGGLTHAQLDAVHTRILEALLAEANSLVKDWMQLKVRLGWIHSGSTTIAPAGYRKYGAGADTHLSCSVSSGPPANITQNLTMSAFMALPSTPGADFVLTTNLSNTAPLDVYLRDIEPALSQVFQFKIAAWVERQLSLVAHNVVAKATEKLRQQGYIS